MIEDINFVGCGTITIFGSQVIIENHIYTSGAATSRNMFFFDHESESKIGILPKTNKFSFYFMLKMN